MSTVDFDAARTARQGKGFILGGERFPIQDVSWEAVNTWEDGDPAGTAKGNTEQTIQFIIEFLLPEDADRFRELAARKEDPLTTGDLLGLTRWLLEQHTARPTMQPGSSGRGQVRLPGGSADAPPSPVAIHGA